MYTTTTTTTTASIICIIIIVFIIDQSSLSSITRTTSINTVDAFQNYAHHHRRIVLHNAGAVLEEQHKQCHYATLETALESSAVCSEYSSSRLPKIRLQHQVELIIPTQLEENVVDDDSNDRNDNDDATILGRSSSSSTSTTSTSTRLNNINSKKSSSSSSSTSSSYSNVNNHNTIASIWANSLETTIPLHTSSRLWLEKNRRKLNENHY